MGIMRVSYLHELFRAHVRCDLDNGTTVVLIPGKKVCVCVRGVCVWCACVGYVHACRHTVRLAQVRYQCGIRPQQSPVNIDRVQFLIETFD